MATELEKMRVVVETKTSGFKKQVDEVKKEAHRAADAADKELGKVGSKANGIKSFRDKVNSIKTAVKSLVGAARLDGGMLKPTKEFSNLTDKIEQSRKRIEVLKKTIEGLNAKGFSGEGAKAELADEESKYAGMMQQAQGMFDESMANGGEGPAFEVNDSLSKIDMLKGAIQGIKSVAAGAFQGFKDAHPVLGRVLSATGKVASTVGKIGIAAGKAAFAGIKKLASGVKNLFTRAHASGSRGLLGGIARMIAGLYLARRALVFLVSGLKEGMNNLAQYSGSTNNSLSMLKSSLTQCKNALATAFAPILSVVAPYLNSLINMVTRAATTLAHFFGALTGKKQVAVATKVNQNYAKGLNGAAAGADKAKKATDKYKRSLMGFDQINKLDDKSNSDSGSGSSGSGGLSPSDMFKTVDVSDAAKKWADKFKEAWRRGDFTEFGRILAAKINQSMRAIPWKQIQSTCNKIATSIGTFINGFVGEFDWKLLAQTISKGIMTIGGAISKLLETINWQQIGRSVVKFISGIDWAGLLRTGFRLVGNIGGVVAGVIAGMIKEAFEGAKKYFEPYIKSSGGNVVLGFFKGIIAGVKKIPSWIKKNIFTPFIKGFKKAFGISSPAKSMKEPGQNIVLGILSGLKDKLKDIIDWFKELPSKIIEAIGGAIHLSVDLVQNGWANVSDWVSERFKDAKATVSVVADAADDVWKLLSGKTTTTITAALEKSSNWSNDAWAAVKTAGTTVTRKLVQSVETGKKWVSAAWSAAKKVGGSVYRSLYQSVKTGSTWASAAWSAAKKGGAQVYRSLYQTVKKGSTWVKEAWAAAQKGGGTIKRGLQITVSWIGSKLKAAWKAITGLASGGIYKNGSWHPVTAAAGGGSFNQGQMFIAREAGPELVGTIGSHTAVVNNDQIVASVSDGVAKAVASAMAGFNNGGTPVILQGDAAKFFKVMQEKANDYTRSTGKAAFPV